MWTCSKHQDFNWVNHGSEPNTKQSKHTLIELAEKRCNSPPFPSCPACTELEHSFWIAGAKFSRPPWKSFSNLDQETSMLCYAFLAFKCWRNLSPLITNSFAMLLNQLFLAAHCNHSQSSKNSWTPLGTTPAYLLFAALSEAVPQFGRDSPCLGSGHHPAFSASSACSCSSFRRFSSQKKIWTQHLSPVCICHALVWNRVRHQTTLSKWTWCQCSGSAPLPSSAFPLALLVWRVHAFPASKGRQGKGRARLQVLSNSFPESFRSCQNQDQCSFDSSFLWLQLRQSFSSRFLFSRSCQKSLCQGLNHFQPLPSLPRAQPVFAGQTSQPQLHRRIDFLNTQDS